jgi:two-component SAPR family response regulator
LHGVNLDVVECDGLELRLRDEVAVDAQLLLAWAARIINGSSRFEDIRLPPNIQDGLCVLPGWCDEWLLAARESLRQTALHALEQLSQRLHQVGRFAEAVEAAVIAVGADPLRDSAQNALVAAHLAEGNLIEAHRARDTYRRIVHRELGVQMPMLTVPAASWGGVGCVRP